jgi:O-antigen ligase
MAGQMPRAPTLFGEFGVFWWLALIVGTAIGTATALLGPLAAMSGVAVAFGLLAGAWVVRAPAGVVTLYAFLLPFDVYLSTTLRVTSTQIFQTLALVGTATGTLLAIGTLRRPSALPGTIVSLGIGLIAYLTLSITWSVNPERSARSLLRTVAAILMAALAAAAIRDRSGLRRVLAAAALGAVVASLYGYAQYIRGGYDPLYRYFSPFYSEIFAARGAGFSVVATFANPNILAGYGAMVIPLMWALASDSQGIRRAGWVMLAGLVSGAVLLTFSKTGWLLVVLLAALWTLARIMTGTRLAFVCGVGILAGIALLLLDPLVNAFTTVFPNAREVSVDSRLGLWRASISAFVESPLFGFGLDGFAAATAETRTGILADLVRAHNIYLQTLVDIGIVGAVLRWAPLLFIYVSGVKVLLREPSGNRSPLQLGLVLSATSFFLFGLVETLDVSNSYVNAYWLVFGLLAASTYDRDWTPGHSGIRA